MEHGMDTRRFTTLNGLALAVAVIFALFPLFWLLVSSFKPWWELAHVPAVWITDQPTLKNYHRVFYPYEDPLGIFQPSSWRAMISSVVISVTATFFSVSFGLMAAIAIARYRTGGNFLPLQILSYRMVPPITLAITQATRPDGARLNPPMGFDYYATMTQEDLEALVAYLRTIPPVKNEVR